MITNLNILFQKMISEEGKTEGIFALSEKDASIFVLRFGHMNITVSKIVVEAMADEDGAEVEEEPEFFVGDF